MEVIIEGRAVNTSDLDFLAKIPLIHHDLIFMQRVFYVNKSRTAFFMFLALPAWAASGGSVWVSVPRSYVASSVSGLNPDAFPGDYDLVKALGLFLCSGAGSC